MKVVVENTGNGSSLLRQTLYHFDGGDTKFFAVCSHLAEGQEEAGAACDKSMKTFHIEAG